MENLAYARFSFYVGDFLVCRVLSNFQRIFFKIMENKCIQKQKLMI